MWYNEDKIDNAYLKRGEGGWLLFKVEGEVWYLN